MTTRVCYRRGDGKGALLSREWLVTNGLGGYASGTVGCVPTRRFHGYLVAALPPPQGRMLVLSHLEERVSLLGNGAGGAPASAAHDRSGAPQDPGGASAEVTLCSEESLEELVLEDGLPVWRHAAVERRVFLLHERNLCVVSWEARQALTLRVRPAFQIRAHEGKVDQPPRDYPVTIDGERCLIDGGSSLPVRLSARGGRWAAIAPETRTVRYAIEEERGYDCEGPLTVPCELSLSLRAGEMASLVVTVEPNDPALDVAEARAAEAARRETLVQAALPKARQGLARELVLAADQFVVRKQGGTAEQKTVIAGYHWFTDWGRDTMISLEGLCLTTGRFQEAARILRTFASHVRDGLIPNLFPEGESQGLYHTADATLWFFHAVDRYTRLSGDTALVEELIPTLRSCVEHHLRGTKFGIHVDPKDGLLHQGAEGYQLTWMDAKVGDWVVTPRRGKAVEINALFYNALCNLRDWTGGDAALDAHAARLRESFNARFFNPGTGFLFDVLDPDDAALRPNQLMAISLPHAVLDPARWHSVLTRVRDELVTPKGLRSLGPREPDYKAYYQGELVKRDAAYHQGTVWAWLIGPFVDAWRKAFPADDAQQFLAGFEAHLSEFGLGSIAEIFDATAPYEPRGCIAQAWSVAEVLRLLATPTAP